MVEQSLGRSLTGQEHVCLIALGVINAVCEDMASRVLWRSMFCLALVDTPCRHTTNVAQAICFGAWHYNNGVPNGISGVVLTGFYGWIMGWLADCNILWLPVAAHTDSDYYIFAILVRRTMTKKRTLKAQNSQENSTSQIVSLPTLQIG